MKLSQRVANLKPSPTLAITAKAKQMKADGIDVIGFGAGEPDFPTPTPVVEAAVAALKGGDTRYTPVGGTPLLKKAISSAFARDYGFTFAPAEITASCGAKHTLFNLFMAIIDPGDEVVVPAPYWVSYPEQVELFGGKAVIAHSREEDDFALTPEALKAALSPRTKAIILNSPCNPSGAMYDQKTLEGIAKVLRGHDCLIVSDDIYHKLVYDGARFLSLLDVAPDLRERTVIVNGVSKSYAMTGWRLGYAAGPKALISAMENLQSQSTSNPTSFVQAGAIEALTGDQSGMIEMVAAFTKRRDLMVERLNAMPGVSCRKPVGAFYVFPNLSGLYGARLGDRVISGSLDISDYLLTDAKVAVVPGEPFGSDAHVRLSYACSDEDIREGLARIEAALGKLDLSSC